MTCVQAVNESNARRVCNYSVTAVQEKIGLRHCGTLTLKDDLKVFKLNLHGAAGRVEPWRLTFDLQADLIVRRAQHAAGHAGVGPFVFGPGSLDLQGPVDVDAVLAAVEPAALSVLKPAHRWKTVRAGRG